MADANFTDTVNIAPEAVAGSAVELWERNRQLDMRIWLANIGENVQVFRLAPNPNGRGHIKCVPLPVDGRNVRPCLGCDYLVVFERDGAYHSVLFELSWTFPDPYKDRKLEQLLASIAFFECYRAVYSFSCNGRLRVEAPRFVTLSCQGNVEDLLRFHSDEPKLHSLFPRVVMPVRIDPGGFSVYYYGGANKVIQVGMATVENGGTLDAEHIFSALPEADPDIGHAEKLRQDYLELVRWHAQDG